MKLLYVAPVVALAALGMLAAPRAASAQWTKGMTRIKQYPPFYDPTTSPPTPGLQVTGDSDYNPQSGSETGLVLNAVSRRGDGEGFAKVIGLDYTVIQEFNWQNGIYGPPSPTFKTDVEASISGEAKPAQSTVPTSALPQQQIGYAESSISVGNLGGIANNERKIGFETSFGGTDYEKFTPVTVHYQTQPTVNIYHAELEISMSAYTSVSPFIASQESDPLPPGDPAASLKQGRPFFQLGKFGFFCPAGVVYYGKACHANCQGTLNFTAPYPAQ